MKVLLDTNAFLWANASPSRLGRQRPLVEDLATDLFVSAASAWEIAIKWALGRLPLPEPPLPYVLRRIEELGASSLPVELRHALAVAGLPLHHRDPFDRLLVAQAHMLSLPIVTADAAIGRYDVEVLQI